MATRNQNAMQGSKNSSQERSTLELERQQAYIRIAVLSLILVYASIISAFYDKSIFPDVVMLVVFLLISFVSTAVIFTQKHFSPYRQFTTNFFDVVMITYLMVSMRRYGIPIFILYQWITIGCGLRFGNKPLVISAIMSMVGFLYVVADTDLWTIEPMFALGVILSLFTVPVYTSVLIKQLRFSRAQALDANDAKSRFLSRVSHDMRTPLNGIMETLNILSKSGSIRFEEQSLLRIIKESVDISLKQVNNVLDFAKIDAGKLQIESQPFNLNEVVNDTRRMASISARDKQLRILTSISPETPIRVVGDAHHLQMILMNLLSNAIKFTHRGYVAISVAPLRSVAEDQNLITIRFSVHDTGIGIDSDALDRIWESFSQESIETRNQYGGTGLGTAIAKQLTGSMGGQVGAQSKKGRGSVFWCDIPVGLIKDQDDSNDRRNAAGGRVLILSRDADYVSATKQRIAATGIGIFNVTTFEEASASVSRAARIGRPWHLVLIDENLLVDEEGQRQEKQFIEGAAAVDGWLYLLSDTPHLNADLFERGYVASLSREISARGIVTLVLWSPDRKYDEPGQSRVLRVAPWVWGNQSKMDRRILVADDNTSNRKIIAHILEGAGYQVDHAMNGDEALEKFSDRTYKAAIIDLHMPIYDGLEVVRLYKQMEPNIAYQRPIVILTTDTTASSKNEAADAGADAYLTKPVDAKLLLDTLEQLIEAADVVRMSSKTGASTEDGQAAMPVLDIGTISNLETICGSASRILDVVKHAENDADNLILAIENATRLKDYEAIRDNAQALRGVAVNVGAVQVAILCEQLVEAEFLDDGSIDVGHVAKLRLAYAEARKALREMFPRAGSSQM